MAGGGGLGEWDLAVLVGALLEGRGRDEADEGEGEEGAELHFYGWLSWWVGCWEGLLW